MLDSTPLHPPVAVNGILADTAAIGFTIASDALTGSLLRMLAATKPGGALLEMGTGTGMGTAWILDGMDVTAHLTTVDRDERVSAIARRHLGHDPRATFHTGDGVAFILAQAAASFDFMFIDSHPGKFTHLDETLRLLKPGGLYVIDDLASQKHFADSEHEARVNRLVATLEGREDLQITKFNWSSGILVAAKKAP